MDKFYFLGTKFLSDRNLITKKFFFRFLVPFEKELSFPISMPNPFIKADFTTRKSLHFVCRAAAALEWTQDLRAAFADLYLLWRSHFELPNSPTEPGGNSIA